MFDVADGSLVADISLGLPDNRATTIGPQHLFVAHDNSFISALNLANNTMALTITGQLIDVDDLAPTARLSAYAVDRSDSVWEYLPTQFGYNALFPSADGVQAIGTSITTDDEYGLFVYGSSVDVYNMAGGALGAAAGSFTIDGTVRDVVTTDSGYSFAGTTDGRVLVWTHRPWIDGVTGSAVAVSEDQEVTVDFTTDRAGDWEIALGGTWQAGGQVLATVSPVPTRHDVPCSHGA